MAKTEKTKHSPLPWKWSVKCDTENRSLTGNEEHVDQYGKCIPIAYLHEGYRSEAMKTANAEFIVHCVNTHDKLVETLKNLVDISLRIGLEDSQPMRDEMAEAVVGAEAALAEVKP